MGSARGGAAGRHGDGGEWSAAKDFAVMMLLTGGNRCYAAQELWLRKRCASTLN